jgi:hypothetical protein
MCLHAHLPALSLAMIVVAVWAIVNPCVDDNVGQSFEASIAGAQEDQRDAAMIDDGGL